MPVIERAADIVGERRTTGHHRQLLLEVLAQGGEFEACGETFGVALGGFAIDQQSDALLERQAIEIR
ncbi:hypothetical protein ACVWXO_000967 [Bradyrhizobium sp. LM2.7]